jgi:5-carboxymethyl-2-hydroxymuconate isomerase
MPHLVILYTSNLDRQTDMSVLCRSLCDAMLQVRDDEDRQVFPTGGTRVLAYPAAHHAVADGKADYGFVYLNLRMAQGRSDATKKRAGEAILAGAKAHFSSIFEAGGLLGITVQVDEGHEVFDGKHSSLHPLFNR